MADDAVVKSITEAIDAVRPALQNDGGDIEFINYDSDKNSVHVKLVGACAGRPMSQIILTNGVQRYLRDTLKNNEIVVVNDGQVSTENWW